MFLSQSLKLIGIPSSAFYFVQGPLLSDSIRQGGRGFGGRGRGRQAGRHSVGKPRARACVLLLISLTFAFRFPLSPAPSRSTAISPKARGAALLSSCVPPAARPGRLFWKLSQEPDCAHKLECIRFWAGVSYPHESTGLQKVFVRMFGQV